MIAPDMANHVSFIFTDAPIARRASGCLNARSPQLQRHHIDGTPPPPTLSCFATGAAARRGVGPATCNGGLSLSGGLTICRDLAHKLSRRRGADQVRRDHRDGRDRPHSARKIAHSIAIHRCEDRAAGEDANWGRVVMAVGKAASPPDRDRLTSFGEHRVALSRARSELLGRRCPHIMKNTDLRIGVDLGSGGAGHGVDLRPHAEYSPSMRITAADYEAMLWLPLAR
jgi:glutamate N-acetyltransferase/amino-acid N-acetyltransferase